MLLITGGSSCTKPALDDCYLLDTELWAFQKVIDYLKFNSELICLMSSVPHLQLDVVLPQGVHSHCAVEHQGSVILIGGLNSKLEAVTSCTKLLQKNKQWSIEDLALSHPLPPRYIGINVLQLHAFIAV